MGDEQSHGDSVSGGDHNSEPILAASKGLMYQGVGL